MKTLNKKNKKNRFHPAAKNQVQKSEPKNENLESLDLAVFLKNNPSSLIEQLKSTDEMTRLMAFASVSKFTFENQSLKSILKLNIVEHLMLSINDQSIDICTESLRSLLNIALTDEPSALEMVNKGLIEKMTKELLPRLSANQPVLEPLTLLMELLLFFFQFSLKARDILSGFDYVQYAMSLLLKLKSEKSTDLIHLLLSFMNLFLEENPQMVQSLEEEHFNHLLKMLTDSQVEKQQALLFGLLSKFFCCQKMKKEYSQQLPKRLMSGMVNYLSKFDFSNSEVCLIIFDYLKIFFETARLSEELEQPTETEEVEEMQETDEWMEMDQEEQTKESPSTFNLIFEGFAKSEFITKCFQLISSSTVAPLIKVEMLLFLSNMFSQMTSSHFTALQWTLTHQESLFQLMNQQLTANFNDLSEIAIMDAFLQMMWSLSRALVDCKQNYSRCSPQALMNYFNRVPEFPVPQMIKSSMRTSCIGIMNLCCHDDKMTSSEANDLGLFILKAITEQQKKPEPTVLAELLNNLIDLFAPDTYNAVYSSNPIYHQTLLQLAQPLRSFVKSLDPRKPPALESASEEVFQLLMEPLEWHLIKQRLWELYLNLKNFIQYKSQ